MALSAATEQVEQILPAETVVLTLAEVDRLSATTPAA
jgi:hypothetical protein